MAENRDDIGAYNMDLAKLIWDEYRYRHELSWKLLFKITFVTSTLSIIPYLNNGIIKGPEEIVLFTPMVGIAVSVLGGRRLHSELKLLEKIKYLHRVFQKTEYGDLYKKQFQRELHNLEAKSNFTKHVKFYSISLFCLASLNFILLLFIFYPKCV